MILELAQARTLRLWIDGQAPDGDAGRGWQYDERDDGAVAVSELDGSPLRVGPYRLVSLKVAVPLCQTHVTPTVVLSFADGTAAELFITFFATGDPDAEPLPIGLSNGDAIEIDECTLFVRAGSAPTA